ncbi:hypothetical protein [Gandjariella thermophila]|uniref:Aminoglycoside phosphotransferase domain-containing protein n=1 Tax=Gandjariella thermophila TaxID=1931992 RepID=A0A4D4J114_9PSEU|nr:hypothetical protein [Gandjariella thermophila]GDY28830.1 hypothetical protein GTS_04630 [Gandjariella thermophila]
MSLVISAGPVDAETGDSGPDPVAAAEAVLSKRFGAPVRLADPEELSDGDKAAVLRVRVAATPFSLPKTLVIKRYPPHRTDRGPDPFAHEAVSYQLFTALAPEERLAPELVAQASEERVVVIEDLGRSPTLADKLLGADARSAERALLSWARTLGRLHAITAGREADFDALMRRLGVRRWQDPLAEQARTALAELPVLLRDTLGVDTAPAVQQRALRTARLLGATRYRAFSPANACPDNTMVTSRGVRFLDFAAGCVRDVALDAAFLRVPFPSCWCAYALPVGMSEAMIAAWRAEVGSVWADLEDDAVLLPRLLDAQLLWVWLSTWQSLPWPAQATVQVPGPRRATALTARWERLRSDAAALGVPELAEHADAVAHALQAQPGQDAVELPLYPAFR